MTPPPDAALQPPLVDEWGVRFNGKAETAGDVWWWTDEKGVRHPLRPATAILPLPDAAAMRADVDAAYRERNQLVAGARSPVPDAALIEHLDGQIQTLLRESESWKALRKSAHVRASAADNALRNISLALGGTDEWTDQETMIACVQARVDALALASSAGDAK